MHKKKHEQFSRLEVNRSSGLRVGGIVVPAMPAYGMGIGGSMAVSGMPEASETPAQEAAESANGTSEAGEGASTASGSGEAAGTSAGSGSAGGM
jgi:hypothetical protein